MTGHVRALAMLQLVYSSIGLLMGVVVFLFFGGIAAIVGVNAPVGDSAVAIPVLTLIGGLTSSVLILMSLPRLLAGIGLWQFRNWGRVLTFVVSIIGLIDLPVGTGLGIYGLWVLTRPEAAAMFEQMPEPVISR